LGKQKNIPELRFTEFKGEWERNKLEDVVKINQGLQIAISERFTEKVENSHFYITNEFLKANSKKKYFIKNPPKSVLCTKDDILMTRTGNTGMVVTNVEGAFHNNFFKVAYPDYINKSFLYNFLKLEQTQKQILKLAGTSTIPDLNHSDFYRIQIPFPTLPEQKRIASFFTVLDKKITELKKKKTLLEHYKKGVVQKLFSQEMRFKDDNGKEFPKWEKKSLGEVFSFRTTNSYSRDNLNYESGDVRNIHYGDIHTKFNSHFDICNEYVPFINSEIDLKRISEDNFCIKGDLIFADASEDYSDVGKCIEIVNLNKEKVLAGLHTILARPYNYRMSVGFAGHLMKSEYVRLQIKTIAQGSKVLSISSTRLSNIDLNIPSEEEQIKITNFLSALDKKIYRAIIQIEKTEIWKKGLLQQMFC